MSGDQERIDMRNWADAVSRANMPPMLTDERLLAAANIAYADITRAVDSLREAVKQSGREATAQLFAKIMDAGEQDANE